MFCARCLGEYPSDFVVCPRDKTELMATRNIGKYVVDGLVGVGGMGAVYRAVNPDTEARVAIKVMKSSVASAESARARFQREAKAVGALKTKHIVQVFDFGTESNGSMFLVMELLEGHELRREITLPPSPMPLARVQMIVDGALRGLAAAHRAGIVHRDLKPENIFVATGDDLETPKVLDFGIAHVDKDAGANVQPLTQTGAMMGTASYMAPEQMSARPGAIGPWTDVYTMGAILYEMLTGSPAFGGTTLTEVLMRVSQTSYQPLATARPGLPAKVYDLVARCLNPDPALRPSDAETVRAQLLEARLVEPGAPIPPPILRGDDATNRALDATQSADGRDIPATDKSDSSLRAGRSEPPIGAPVMYAALTHAIDDAPSARRLLDYFTPTTRPANAILFSLGDDSGSLFLVEAGELEAEIPSSSGAARRVRLAAGSVIGETGLYRKAKRSATIRTLTACTLLEVSASALANMQRDAPELVTKFHQFVTASLAQRIASDTSSTSAAIPVANKRAWWPFALVGAVVIGGAVLVAVTRGTRTPPPPPPPVRDASVVAAIPDAGAPPVDAPPAGVAHPGMVRIDGGTFHIGQAGTTWLPPATVTLEPFWIDEHEMTHAEIASALGDKLPATTRDKTRNDPPAMSARFVTWLDAAAACASLGKRLPSEAEWEVATTDTPREPARARLRRKNSDADLTAPSTDCSPAGLCDMLGGLSEWTAEDVAGRVGFKAVRGASYRDLPGSKLDTIHQRQLVSVTDSDNTIGFRCALSIRGSR